MTGRCSRLLQRNKQQPSHRRKSQCGGFAPHRGEAAAHHRKRGFSPPAVQQPQPKPTQLPPDTHPAPRVAPTLLTYKQPTTDYRPGTYRRQQAGSSGKSRTESERSRSNYHRPPIGLITYDYRRGSGTCDFPETRKCWRNAQPPTTSNRDRAAKLRPVEIPKPHPHCDFCHFAAANVHKTFKKPY